MRISLPIFILLLTVTSSCVGLKPVDNAKPIAGAKEIEGHYANVADNYENLSYRNLSNIIDFKGKVQMSEVTSVAIKILDRDEILFLFADKTGDSKPYTCKYRFKDGVLYLKNKNFRLTGIPYLLGGYKINKTALAKNDNGDLLLSAVQADEGAILVIFPASMPVSHFRNLYPKASASASRD